MTRKIIAMLLAVIMCLSISSVAFAAENNMPSPDGEALAHAFDDSYWEPVYVTLDDGTVEKVYVHSDSDADTASVSESSTSPQSSLIREYPVGTQKSTEVKISNGQLGSPYALGSLLSSNQKSKLADLSAKATNSKVGIIVATAAKILSAIGNTNAAFGNSGFIVSTKWEYRAHFINSQGHNVYSWDLIQFSLKTY